MSTDLETARVGETIDIASTIIALADIRHLPILDAGEKLAGVVTHRDLLAKFGELEGRDGEAADGSQVRVEEIMTVNVATVGPEDPVLKAAEIMLERKYGCLPVVADDGKVLGIVTESDFVEIVAQDLSNPRS